MIEMIGLSSSSFFCSSFHPSSKMVETLEFLPAESSRKRGGCRRRLSIEGRRRKGEEGEESRESIEFPSLVTRDRALARSPFVSFFFFSFLLFIYFFFSPSTTIGRSTIVTEARMGIFRGSRLFPAGVGLGLFFSAVVENVVATVSSGGNKRQWWAFSRMEEREGEGEIRLGIIKWLRGDLASMDRYAGRGKVELSRCLLIDAIVVRRC